VSVTSLPHAAPFTVHDLFEMPDDGNRYEVLEGSLIVSPAPTPAHQLAADRLRALLVAAAPPDLKVLTTVTVRLGDDGTGFVPDVVVTPTSPEEMGAFLDPHEVLAVVEVVSPGSRTQDRTIKAEEYAAVGIPSYWRVELTPYPGQRDIALPAVLVHELDGGACQLITTLTAGTTGEATLPFPIRLDPATLTGRRRR